MHCEGPRCPSMDIMLCSDFLLQNWTISMIPQGIVRCADGWSSPTADKEGKVSFCFPCGNQACHSATCSAGIVRKQCTGPISLESFSAVSHAAPFSILLRLSFFLSLIKNVFSHWNIYQENKIYVNANLIILEILYPTKLRNISCVISLQIP